MGSDPTGDKDDHILAILVAAIDPIYQSPLEYEFKGGGEVYMVGNREEILDKSVKEIQ
jgi:hypothetical protein